MVRADSHMVGTHKLDDMVDMLDQQVDRMAPCAVWNVADADYTSLVRRRLDALVGDVPISCVARVDAPATDMTDEHRVIGGADHIEHPFLAQMGGIADDPETVHVCHHLATEVGQTGRLPLPAAELVGMTVSELAPADTSRVQQTEIRDGVS